MLLHLEICQQSRPWECGNPKGISKECGKGGKPTSWLSMLCHFIACFGNAFHTVTITVMPVFGTGTTWPRCQLFGPVMTRAFLGIKSDDGKVDIPVSRRSSCSNRNTPSRPTESTESLFVEGCSHRRAAFLQPQTPPITGCFHSQGVYFAASAR
jgi:hypothetical protein